MQTTKELIACAKLAQGVSSDYGLAKLLEVTPQAIQNWNNGRSQPDDEVGARLAELAGQNPGAVVAELHAQRAKTMESKALWMRMAKQLRETAGQNVLVGVAAAVVAGAFVPSPARAEVAEPASSKDYVNFRLRPSWPVRAFLGAPHTTVGVAAPSIDRTAPET